MKSVNPIISFRLGCGRLPFIGSLLTTACWLFLVFIFSGGFQGLVQAQQCFTLSPTDGETGYQPRGNRCEGLYKSNVAGGLLVVSLLQGALDTAAGDVLSVAPSFNPQISLNIRALPLSVSTHYRMDAIIRQGDELKWPTRDVLSRIPLQTSKLGVFGWYGGENDKVLVPVRVTREGASPSQGETTLIVRSSINVTRAAWRWSPAEGNACSSYNDPKEVNVVAFSGSRLIKIPLTGIDRSLICIEVRAKESNGDWLPPLRTKIRRS